MRLTVSTNKRFLQYDDGSPFFYLGDTCWEMFHRLARTEMDDFLTLRASQGFTVIQAVALAEFDGLDKPDPYGHLPLLKNARGRYDPSLPDPSGYWDSVDFAMERAAQLGIFIGLLPSWGDKWNKKWGVGPEIFDEGNARAYGAWIGARYARHENIIWIMGGDRPVETEAHLRILRAMAEGIREADGGVHLCTFHPVGGSSSAEHVNGEGWLDFHMLQTGHALECYQCYDRVRAVYDAQPTRPVMDGEPRYEDHPACFDAALGYTWTADDVRQSAYWDVLSGAFGHTYGNHCVWSFNRVPEPYFPYAWREAVLHYGAAQMRHLKHLILSRPFFERRPAQELIEDASDVTGHMAAARGDRYAFVYSPLGLPFSVHMEQLGGRAVKAHWFDPRTGALSPLGIYPVSGLCAFAPPAQGKGNDAVLVLDAVE